MSFFYTQLFAKKSEHSFMLKVVVYKKNKIEVFS
jgi:hypothetical protein